MMWSIAPFKFAAQESTGVLRDNLSHAYTLALKDCENHSEQTLEIQQTFCQTLVEISWACSLF